MVIVITSAAMVMAQAVDMKTQKGISTMYFLILAALCIVGAAILTAVVWAVYISPGTKNTWQNKHGYNANVTVVDTLNKSNEAYRQANSLVNEKIDRATDTAQYIADYKRALADATDPLQEGHIKYTMAVAYLRGGDYMNAIPLLKEVGSSQQYAKVDKASAIQTLGSIRFSYDDPTVDSLIFADPPYSAMLAKDDYIATYIKLFLYGRKFSPLASIEARLAQLYSLNIMRSYQSSHSTTTPEILGMKKQLDMHLQKARKGLASDTNAAQTAAPVQAALLRIATTNGLLAVLGMEKSSVAEADFEKAGVFNGASSNDGFWNFQYARYLSEMYGATKSAKITELLSHIYTGGYKSSDPIEQFLAHERMNYLGAQPSIVRLASIDPEFKEFLLTLGWLKKDF